MDTAGCQHPGYDFAKPDGIKCDGDRLGKKEHSPYRPAEFHAQGTGDEVVIAAASHPEIRGNGGQGERGEYRDGIGHGDDHKRLQQPGIPDNVAEPHEEDDPEDGEYARGKNPGKRTQCPR